MLFDSLSVPALIFIGAISVVVLIGLFLIPYRVALKREHPNATAILICSGVGLVFWPVWFIALIWSFTGPNHALIRKQAIMSKAKTYQPQPRKHYNEETPDELIEKSLKQK